MWASHPPRPRPWLPVADGIVAPEPQTPADKQLDQLAAERFAALMTRYPVYATFLGLH